MRSGSPLLSMLLIALVTAFAYRAHAAEPPPKPQRIVSINLCTDQILVDVVEPSRIAALSHLADDETVSNIARRSQQIPRVRGEAEEILRLDPDLVLAGAHSTPATVALLERLGRRVIKVPLANDLESIRQAVRTISNVVGETRRGLALISDLDAALSQIRARDDNARPTALVYQVNDIASGPGTLADAALAAAGFRNLAADLPRDGGDRVALEAIVARPPDLLVLSAPPGAYRTPVAENLSHPALKLAMRGRRTLVLPWRHWLCGTPRIAEAIAQLAAARHTLPQSGDSK